MAPPSVAGQRGGAITAALVAAALLAVLLLQLAAHGSPRAARLAAPPPLAQHQQVDAAQSRMAIETGEEGLAQSLAYVADPAAAARLGCPLDHTMACFYRFENELPELSAPEDVRLVMEENCTAVFRPIPSDHGRPWCVRQGKEPSWLAEDLPQGSWRRFDEPVLLTGRLDSPNPTHQTNLHFLGVWRWMKRMQLSPGQLRMLVDHGDPAWAPGKYGAGLARALGSLTWLPQLEPTVHLFETLQFSIPGAELFPFDLKHRMLDEPLHLDLLELAANVRRRVLPPPPAAAPDSADTATAPASLDTAAPEAAPPKAPAPARVLLAKRREAETRIWDNAEEVAQYLQTEHGLDAEVVVLGELSFEQQVARVAAADVLVGVHGSDLVSMMFLPPTASVVEIFPTAGREVVVIPELQNFARMLGKNHFTHVANVTRSRPGEARLLYRAKGVRTSVADLAALVSFAAEQALSGVSMQHSSCEDLGSVIRCASRVRVQQERHHVHAHA